MQAKEISDQQISNLLHQAKTIAIIGLSPDPSRPSNRVAAYLIAHGYEIVGIHPTEREILGRPCYPSLQAVPFVPDIVDVFRKSEAVPEIVQEVIRKSAKTLWLQEGVMHPAAEMLATQNGILVLSDICIKKEHQRLF